MRGKLVLLVGWCGRVAALAIATAVLAVANPSSEGRAAAFHAQGQSALDGGGSRIGRHGHRASRLRAIALDTGASSKLRAELTVQIQKQPPCSAQRRPDQTCATAQ